MQPSADRSLSSTSVKAPLLLCLSHLRWAFVWQRPQHLMGRFAGDYDVLFWEEPIYGAASAHVVEAVCDKTGVRVLTPHLPDGLDADQQMETLQDLLAQFVLGGRVDVAWYYTPMMVPVASRLQADCVVYDCMDELANFKNAPPELLQRETQLLAAADLVFTGGFSLYEAKRGRHPHVHPFPSSVDVAHFAQSRVPGSEPEDQQGLGRPRLGYAGVIDERMDLALLGALADARPDWTLVMVGPVVKIDPAELPERPNIHYLGGKSYAELPDYMRGWDVALMPFAINEATRFISPTKTPEYLAAGCSVVSTPIADVIRHYGEMEGVRIAGDPAAFIRECDFALALGKDADAPWRDEADRTLGEMSWDLTQARMEALIDRVRRPGSRRDQRVVALGVPKHYDTVVVGAGFAGAVMAERLAADGGQRVLVVDQRPHIAGNAYDRLDDAGILIHQYGPHIFHTNSEDVFEYLSRFTDWRPYEHRVLAAVRDKLVPIPINRTTLEQLYGVDLPDEASAAAFLASRAEQVEPIRTSRDVVISAVGSDLYRLFFEGYTRKQWGLDPSQLDKSVTARVPTRTNTDDRYFTDRFQAMPADGYTRMFERMLDHPGIDVWLGVRWQDVREQVTWDHLVFTGPIDEYFDHRYGKLPYRSLEFRHEIVGREWFQPVATVNYPAPDVPYTRITEYKHLTGQQAPSTSITYEYPRAVGDPYYPIPRAENQALYRRYEALALAEPNVSFVGRLATYKYYNMDQVVGQALATYRRLKAREQEKETVSAVG